MKTIHNSDSIYQDHSFYGTKIKEVILAAAP